MITEHRTNACGEHSGTDAAVPRSDHHCWREQQKWARAPNERLHGEAHGEGECDGGGRRDEPANSGRLKARTACIGRQKSFAAGALASRSSRPLR